MILSDIEFASNHMILGLRDRTGDQLASGVIIDGNTINGVQSRGDVVCATYNPLTQTYTPEPTNNCGGYTASGTGQGDENGEFFWGGMEIQ